MPISAAEDWQRCKPWIEAALARSLDCESIETVERKIADGSYQFWAGERAAAITEIGEFNGVKLMILRHAGGTLNDLTTKLEPMLCEFGRSQGCVRIRSEGREGWKEIGKKMGYRLATIAMVKDL